MVQRNQLRQQLRTARKGLSQEQQTIAAQAVTATTVQLSQFTHAQSFGAYLVNDGEINPEQIIQTAWQQGKTVYLPKIKADNRMEFVLYEPDSELKQNQYGILEPIGTTVCEQLDCLLLPLVAFDAQGNRLGMGGGYYDRYLEQYPAKHLIGLAHQLQQVELLDAKEWDIPLDGIVSDQQTIWCP